MDGIEGLSPEDPRTLGSYRLLGRLGEGGMGRVYLARSGRGRTVAVKVVRPELAGQEEFRRRFAQEVRSARRVGGEWTAPVLDAETEAAVPWVATGYIAGPSLGRVVDRDFGPLPERSVRILGAGLARALQSVHAAGIVHRDLKPSNVLITLDGPRVIDFGIARALETVTGAGLTRTGATVGSPGFMSPEQVRGDAITPASDVFGLGSVLAYAAGGRMPFGAADSAVHSVMYRIVHEEPELAEVPDGLRPLIAACLAKEPGDRPTPAEVLARTGVQDQLEDLRSAEPWLPGGLVAQLGRHAISLLEVEEPTRTTGHPPTVAEPIPPAAEPPTHVGPPPGGRPADPPTLTAQGGAYPPHHQPMPPHTPETPVPGAYGPYGGPQRHSKTPYLVALIVAAGLLTGGGTVYLLNRDTKTSGQASGTSSSAPAPGPSSAPDSPSGRSTPPRTDPTPPTDNPTTKDPTPAGEYPGYSGTWQTTFDSGAGPNYRIITVTGDVTIQGSGTLSDGTSYTCRWHAAVTGGGGGSLRLGPSTVTQANPSSACQPGSPSSLTLLPDNRMRRDFTDSGTKDASLVYSKTG
ncbi:serine/threonine-protein kinase [Streptomyces sp. DSM 40473]|uniref:Serine/threonine-protein kinase n=1 Tax=Streptomyces hesseae TaxID=3075519 RepID=A0ABU2SR28_9ACTN|nr:serine/threonine-protein kinase [Streptomyces sp. DSM 40473]MDT0451457.1 serine/threonine-protein kinase [Streptomyces sp. DSM 40473]